MPDLKILTPNDFKSMPWRNGKGNTIELSKKALPNGDEFAWRLSMADVITDGEFSNFSGYNNICWLFILRSGIP